MLFSIFKKTEKQNDVLEHIKKFKSQFTDEQKKTIMASLFLIANSDGEYHSKEVEFFKKTASLLNYKLPKSVFYEFMSISNDELFQDLNSLTESQKDWYIITALAMIHSDGQALEVELLFLETFFIKMGITEKRFNNVIKKTPLLSELYRKRK
jgi:hypothetical protein